MILTGVDNSILLRSQPVLANHYPVGQTTWTPQIEEATRQIVRELKKHRKDLKKFCTPLSLAASNIISAETTTDAIADTIDRMLFKVEVTSFSEDVSFELLGSNDDFTTQDIVTTLSFTDAGTKYAVFTSTYKKYKIHAVATASTTYKADLIESSFYHAQLWLSISLAFKTLVKAVGDRFDYLSNDYFTRYQDEMNSMVATYDEDGSGDVSTEYETMKVTSVEFLR